MPLAVGEHTSSSPTRVTSAAITFDRPATVIAHGMLDSVPFAVALATRTYWSSAEPAETNVRMFRPAPDVMGIVVSAMAAHPPVPG